MKKSVIIGMLTFFACPDIPAQIPDSIARTIDSLIQIRESSSGRARYDATFRIAYDLFDIDNVAALKYAEEAVELAGQSSDSSLIVTSGRLYGQLLRRTGRLDEAIKVMVPLTYVAARHNYAKDLRFLHNALAIAYTFRGQYDHALEQNFKSLRLREQLGDKKEISIALGNIGTTYYLIGMHDKAVEFFNCALSIDSLHEYSMEIQISRALAYGYLGEYSTSLILLDRLKSDSLTMSNVNRRSMILHGLGYAEGEQREFDVAQRHLETALDLAMESKNRIYQVDNLALISKFSIDQGQLSNAQKLLTEAESIALNIKYRGGLEKINQLLAKLYTLNGDFLNASRAKSKLLAIRDSSLNHDIVENIARVQYDYHNYVNRQVVENQRELLILKEASLKYYRWFILILIFCLSLLFVIVALLHKVASERKIRASTLEIKVRERTAQLLSQVDSLNKSQLSRRFLLDSLANRLNASIASILGLSAIARTYKDVPYELVYNIEAVTRGLREIQALIAANKRDREGHDAI